MNNKARTNIHSPVLKGDWIFTGDLNQVANLWFLVILEVEKINKTNFFTIKMFLSSFSNITFFDLQRFVWSDVPDSVYELQKENKINFSTYHQNQS